MLGPSLQCSVLSVNYRSNIVVQLAEFLNVVCLVVFVCFSVVELNRDLLSVRSGYKNLPSTDPSVLISTSAGCLHPASRRESLISFQGQLLVNENWVVEHKFVWPRNRCCLSLRSPFIIEQVASQS